MLAFLDLETTGLDPRKERILEVACIITDDKFVEVKRDGWLVRCDRQFHELDEYVRDMHTKSGLWKDLSVDEWGGTAIDAVDYQLAELLREHAVKLGKDDKGKVTLDRPQLAGNTISFDRAFMKMYLPNAEAELHYRNLDVSSINELMRRANPKVWEGRPRLSESAAHRAMADCEDSLTVCRYYAERVGGILVAVPSPDNAAATVLKPPLPMGKDVY